MAGRLIRAVILMLAVALTAAADPPPPVWQGVWQGRVGALPIRVCLNRNGVGEGLGAYYYLSKLRAIALEQQGASKVWSEGDADPKRPQPRWTFATVTHDALDGQWNEGTRTLPFRLARVANGDDDQPCGSEAFNGPRWRPLRVIPSLANKDGVPYRELGYDPGPGFPDVGIAGFELLGTDPVSRRINADLYRQLIGKDGEDWRSCIESGLDSHGVDGDTQTSLTPTVIAPRWLGASLDASEDCGGAHPNSGSQPLTYDRATGKRIDLQTWLNDVALDRTDMAKDMPATVRPALRGLLIRLLDPDSDCREPLGEADYWDVGLDRNGLAFTPELGHAVQACADTAVLPWRAATRFLSPAGRAGMATMVPIPH